MGLNHNWGSGWSIGQKTALVLFISVGVGSAYGTQSDIDVDTHRIIDDLLLDANCDDADISNDFGSGVSTAMAVFGLLIPLDCKQSALQFNATTFGSNIWVTDVDLTIDVISIETENCDITRHEEDILSIPIDDLMINIGTNTEYVDNDDWCTQIGSATIDLGDQAVIDFNNALQDDGLFAVGLRWDVLPLPGLLETNQVTINLDNTFLTIDYIATTFEVGQEVETIGDHFKITSWINITRFPTVFHNITSILHYEEGDTLFINGTDVNKSGIYNYVYPPRWPQINEDGLREIKSEVILQDRLGNIITNETISSLAREYDAMYKPSISDGLGRYNYTVKRIDGGDTIWLKINRINAPSGETWPLNCNLLNNEEAIKVLTSPEPLGRWNNESDIGYRNFTTSGWGGNTLYGTCYNPHDIVFHFTLYGNESLAQFGAQGFDDLFGGFIGVPVGILFVALIAYLATPKTAPTYIIIVMAVIALVSAMGIVSITENSWSLIIIGAAVGLLVKKLL